jgi:hypothetical protein
MSSATLPPKKKRKVSPAGCKAKGSKAEAEFVAICIKLGLPAVRVVGSGAFKGAAADMKIGVKLDENGQIPKADECRPIHRVECKSHASTPDSLFLDTHKDEKPFTIVMSDKGGTEKVWGDLNQHKDNNALVLRRSKAPSGAIKEENWDAVYTVCLPVTEYISLLKRAYPDFVAYYEADLEDKE